MFTPKKRQLRRKRFFLPEQETFALFNANNLKASEVAKMRISLKNAKLYFVPLYLKPPKLASGSPLIMVIYDKLEDLQTNLPQIIKEFDCIGVLINKKWYPTNFFTEEKTTNLNKSLLALILTKTEKNKN